MAGLYPAIHAVVRRAPSRLSATKGGRVRELAWDRLPNLKHGFVGATWMTGTYDAETDTLFWGVGNPYPAINGDERQGDNLYTASVLALNPETGALKWYYQFTPHDLHDWDGGQTPMVVNTMYRGQPRKLLIQANRNGFFYVFDRTNGQLLLGEKFVDRLNWASGIGKDGRPILLQIADVFVVYINIYETAEAAVVGEEMLLKLCELARQRGQRFSHRRGLQFNTRLFARIGAQRRGYDHLDCHSTSSSSIS